MVDVRYATLFDAGERIYRYELPVDDEWHEFTLWGDPLAVECRKPDAVEFWSRDPGDLPVHGLVGARRSFIVVGTGQQVPTGVRYWGTALVPGEALVWHLLERRP